MIRRGENGSTRRSNCPIATLPTTYATCTDLQSKPSLRGKKPVEVFYLKIQLVPRSKHSVSVIKIRQLMLYREIIAVCSEIHTEHINTLCGQNVELYTKTQSYRAVNAPSLL